MSLKLDPLFLYSALSVKKQTPNNWQGPNLDVGPHMTPASHKEIEFLPQTQTF